jgi:hypothetical protein
MPRTVAPENLSLLHWLGYPWFEIVAQNPKCAKDLCDKNA